MCPRAAAAIAKKRRADVGGAAGDQPRRHRRLRPDHRRHTGLEDRRLLGRHPRQRLAKVEAVVERDRGDGAQPGPGEDVGGVEAPAQADLEQHHIGGLAGEGQKRGGGGDLEEGDRFGAVRALAFLQERDQAVLGDDGRRSCGYARRSGPGAARCTPARGARRPSRMARRKAISEPLPLVPATCTTGASPACGLPRRASSPTMRPSERSMTLG